MGLKKRVANFVSNWLGVIIATVIIIVSAVFGGMYLYDRSIVDNSINDATQIVTLLANGGFVQTGTTDNPPGYTYHLIIQVWNRFNDALSVEVSDISVIIDTYSFPVVEDGQWSKNVQTGYATFEGYITIDKDTFSALVDKSPVSASITGNITASGQHGWVKRSATREFKTAIADESHPMYFEFSS